MELQQMKGDNPNEFIIRTKLQGEAKDLFPTVQRAIASRFPNVTVEFRGTDRVGPKVGSELRQKAVWAILLSLGGILLYVGFRYEFKFALGAVVALFHDVFVTLGMLMFTHREISLTVVAALLTIAGYSINDTIVVFDRIRERSKALRKEKHSRAMDLAVNETLSRTVITAFTVFLTALVPVHLGRRGAARLLVRDAGRCGVRHLLVRVRRERTGAGHLDLPRSPQGHSGRVRRTSDMQNRISRNTACAALVVCALAATLLASCSRRSPPSTRATRCPRARRRRTRSSSCGTTSRPERCSTTTTSRAIRIRRTRCCTSSSTRPIPPARTAA
jgi:preprotein translocase SecF subunit